MPQTIETAVASPRARPIPNIIALKIPDLAPPITILKSVWVLVAPKASEALIWSCFIALIEVILNIVIVGIIIIIKTIIVERVDDPPAVWHPKTPAKSRTIGQIKPCPNNPKTIEGMEAKSSITISKDLPSFFGAILTIKRAVKTEITKAKTEAIKTI